MSCKKTRGASLSAPVGAPTAGRPAVATEGRPSGRSPVTGATPDHRLPATTLASDAERESIVAQLRAAHAEGRLDYAELEERTATAYRARTHGDLVSLTADLPPASPTQPLQASSRVHGSRIALTASWSAWAAAVAVNVVIWLLVSLGADESVYFWPIWVAGPWGAVLVVTSIAALIATRRPPG